MRHIFRGVNFLTFRHFRRFLHVLVAHFLRVVGRPIATTGPPRVSLQPRAGIFVSVSHPGEVVTNDGRRGLHAQPRLWGLDQGTEGHERRVEGLAQDIVSGATHESVVIAGVFRSEFAQFLDIDRQMRRGLGPGDAGRAEFRGVAQQGQGFG